MGNSLEDWKKESLTDIKYKFDVFDKEIEGIEKIITDYKTSLVRGDAVGILNYDIRETESKYLELEDDIRQYCLKIKRKFNLNLYSINLSKKKIEIINAVVKEYNVRTAKIIRKIDLINEESKSIQKILDK